jgi:hypothetical protein
MTVDRVFVFEYQRRGSTRIWDAIDPVRVEKVDPDDEWEDGEVQFERDGGRIFIRVCWQEAIEKDDALIAEQLANDEFEKCLPGHEIVYQPLDEEDAA